MDQRSLRMLFRFSITFMGLFSVGCKLGRARYVNYQERDGLGTATSTQTDVSTQDKPTNASVGTGQPIKKCESGGEAFNINIAKKVSPRECSCHGSTAPVIGVEAQVNRLNLLAAKKIFQYDWMTGSSHPGGESFKKISQAELEEWQGAEASACDASP